MLVGGWPTPLKNMSSSVGIILPNWMESHKTCSSHHQPVMSYSQHQHTTPDTRRGTLHSGQVLPKQLVLLRHAGGIHDLFLVSARDFSNRNGGL